jgi:hypothetical protein
VDIVQQAYYGLCQNTWGTPFIKIDDRSDAWIMYDDDMLRKTKYFLNLLNHLITNRRTRKAILYAWVCNKPLAWMYNLAAKPLKGGTSFCSNFTTPLTQY